MTDTEDTSQVSDYLRASRRLRPCFDVIDLRGKVTAPCTRYLINDRVHYLDDASFRIFEEGLRRHHGVLTMETFDAIVALPETGGGSPHFAASPATAEPILRPPIDADQPVTVDAVGPAVESLPFGFFAQRREQRLDFVCEIQLSAAGRQVRGVTFDLSVSGARISVQEDPNVEVGSVVTVSFMGLNTEARGIDVYDVPYHVVRRDVAEGAVLLGLRRVDARRFAPFAQFLASLIARHDAVDRSTGGDDYKAALVWYYERLIAQNSAQIPFFVSGEGGALRLDAVAASPGNQFLLRFFATSEDNYNFTPLCLPDRLQALAAGQSVIVIMYRDQGEGDRSARIHSASNLDYSDDRDFAEFLRHARTHAEYCVVLAVAGKSGPCRPHAAKLELLTQRLRALDPGQAVELTERLGRLTFVGYLFDLTGFATDDRSDGVTRSEALVAWVGTELRNVVTGAVERRIEVDPDDLAPELLRFGYVERRREERYLARTSVQLRMRERTFSGMTLDISWHGLRAEFPDSVDARRGTPVFVGLPSMQKKREFLDLMEIPYRVVGSRDLTGTTQLMLERVSGVRASGVDDFFSELIRNNRDKLRVDAGDSVQAASSGAYECAFAANLPSVAFFIARDPHQGVCLQFVGGADVGVRCDTDSAGHSREVFELLNPTMVKSIYDAVQLQCRHDETAALRSPFEFLLYFLPRESDSAGGETGGRVVSDFTFEDSAQRRAFLGELAGNPRWRVLRVSAHAPVPPQDIMFDHLLEGLRGRSKHRAIRLSDTISTVVACGEMFEITAPFTQLLQLKN